MDPFNAKWAVRNRVDLHPEVMIRAVPDGVWFTTFPRIHNDGSNMVWSCAAKHYNPGPRGGEGTTAQRLPQAGGGSDEGGHKAARGGGEPSDEKTAASAGLQGEFEGALEKAQRKAAANIRRRYKKLLGTATRRRRRRVPDSPAAPFPEETARMKEWMEVVSERAMPKVRAAVQRTFGIEPGPATADESEAVGESERVLSSPKTHERLP